MLEKNLSKGNIQALLRTNKADENWEVIEQYLIAGGEGVELTDLQQRMYDRFEFIDEMLKKAKFRRYEIVNMVSVKFGVSKDTARRDIVGAEMVYSSTFPLNKKYMIGIRINFLERQINLAAAANDFKSVEGLEKTLAKYLEMYPDSTTPRSPKKIIMNFNQTVFNEQVLENTEEAMVIVDDELKKLVNE